MVLSVTFSAAFLCLLFQLAPGVAAVVDSVTFDVVVSVTVAAAFVVSALVVAAVVTELSLPAFVVFSLSLEASPDTSPSPDFSVASDSFVPVSLPAPVSFEALPLSFVVPVSLVLPPLFVVLSCFVDAASVLVDVSAGSFRTHRKGIYRGECFAAGGGHKGYGCYDCGCHKAVEAISSHI